MEGISEFLPISSTGHLILTSEILKIPESDFLKTFEISIQLGAILSVVVLYWRKLLVEWGIMKRIIIAFIPTGILGLVFYKIIKTYLMGNQAVVLWALFLGGIFLIVFEFFYKKREILKPSSSAGRQVQSLLSTKLTNGDEKRISTEKGTLKGTHTDEILPPLHTPSQAEGEIFEISYKKSFLIGVFQSISMIPGVSRSAATIIGGLMLGISRQTIVEFSFLLAAPTMAAATGLDLIKNASSFNLNQFGILAVGFIVSFLIALASIKWLLKFIKNHSFISFGVYRIIVAVLFWLVVL